MMRRLVAPLVAGLTIVGLLLGPSSASHAQEALPAGIQSLLSDAASRGDTELLEAVAVQVTENPGLAQAIVDAATRLKPELTEAIVASAIEAGGAGKIVLSAGPASPTALALVGLGAAAASAAVVTVLTDDYAPGAPAGSPPPGPDPSPFETTEYLSQEGLGRIGASYAYARGFTGAGIIVAVLDSGLDIAHPEFAGRIAPGGFDFVLGTPAMTDPEGHGTHVSGIIAANDDGVGMHGVAPGAQVLPIRIIDAAGFVSVTDAEMGTAFDATGAGGAAVINNSWGTTTPVTDPFLTAANITAAEPLFIAAVQTAVAADQIIVFAAGNDAFNEVSVEAGLPRFFPGLKDLWVAVVSVGHDGLLSSFSNRCGVAAAWCIAAPGGDLEPGELGINSTQSGGGYVRSAGTSMAAPHVSGALAVILELFAGLTAQEAVQRLFVSANSNFIYSNPAVTGHGLLDLEAATRPLGWIFVATGKALDGPTVALETTRIRLGRAFGDGLARRLADASLAVFDSYGAPFYVDLDALVQPGDGRLALDSLLRRFGKGPERQKVAFGRGEISYGFRGTEREDAATPGDGEAPQVELEALSFTQSFGQASEFTFAYNLHPALAFGLHGSGIVDRAIIISDQAFATPYLAFAERGYSLATSTELPGLGILRLGSFFGDSEDQASDPAFGTAAELTVPLGRRANVSVQLGLLSETETLLGSHGEGAFDLAGGVPTYFGGVSGQFALSDTWRLVGSGYAGLTHAQAARNSLITGISPILSQSFTAGILGQGVVRAGDRFGFMVNQPLRVIRGEATFSLATGRDTARNVLRQDFTAELAPGGRELNLETFYDVALGERSRLTASTLLRMQPGHLEQADPEAIFMLRFDHRF